MLLALKMRSGTEIPLLPQGMPQFYTAWGLDLSILFSEILLFIQRKLNSMGRTSRNNLQDEALSAEWITGGRWAKHTSSITAHNTNSIRRVVP